MLGDIASEKAGKLGNGSKLSGNGGHRAKSLILSSFDCKCLSPLSIRRSPDGIPASQPDFARGFAASFI